MRALPMKKKWTVEEYLAFDRAADVKHEYLDGEVYAMAGAKPEHNIIAANTVITIGSQILSGNCTIFSSDQKVDIGQAGLYAYPDIAIVCGQPIYDDQAGDMLRNPTLLVEVLSPATEKYDRTEKFRRYQSCASLRDYVLIAQDRVLVEVFSRQADDRWLYQAAYDLDSTIALESIGCTLALADVYRRVSFEEPAEPDHNPPLP